MNRGRLGNCTTAFLLIVFSLGCGSDGASVDQEPVFVPGSVAIIPQPASVSVDAAGSVFALSERTQILSQSDRADVQRIAENLRAMLVRRFPSMAAVREHREPRQPPRSILLTTAGADAALGAESYSLIVTSERIVIRAPTPAGLFFGVQSLRQLAPSEIETSGPATGVAWMIPSVAIEDRPRFRWRGFMLDVSRTFYPKEFVLRYIDLLALYKFNKLHLHLTDDQGWRIEIERHPELHTLGSQFDAQRHPDERSGYYSKDDLREIVDHAARAFIEVIPEIDMPGHSVAILHALPELACTRSQDHVRTSDEFPIVPWSYRPFPREALCACDERVYEIIQDVLDEVLEIFPSRYVHLGGDEVPKQEWRTSYLCEELIREENLRSLDHVQALFTKRMEDFLLSRGKVLIGWDEILFAELSGDESTRLSDDLTIMQWRNILPTPERLYQRDVIQSPWSELYLDLDIPLETTYLYDPVPDGITAEQASRIIGAQGNMWTAFRGGRTEEEVDAHVFPRLLAIAELTWSPRDLRDFADFEERRADHVPRLDLLGVARGPCRDCVP